MLIRWFLLRVLICLAFALANPLQAATMGPQLRDLAVLEDAGGHETITSIATSVAHFQPLSGGTFSGGYTRSAYWMRFTVAEPVGEYWLDILPPYLDDLRLFESDPAHPGSFTERRAGDELPYSAREVDYRGFVFKLHHDSTQARTYYLRLATTSTSNITLRLSTPDGFFARTTNEVGLLMAIQAAMLTVLLFNINNWFWLRYKLTLWFLAYLASITLNFAGYVGFIQQYLTPDWSRFNYYLISMMALLPIAFGNAFYRRMLLVDRSQGVMYWLFEAGFWLPLLAVASIPFGYFTEAMPVALNTVPFTTFCGTWLAIQLWRRKSAGGFVMLLANLISMTGIFIFMLHIQGVITGGFFLLHALQISLLGSILSLQIAIGIRYRVQREEHQRTELEARSAALDAQRERDTRTQQSKFLSMLAHELRTSLSVLRMAIGSQPMTPKAIASAERALHGMSDVIEGSLQAEKLADGAVQLERAPCDVSDMVQAVVADSQDPARVHLVGLSDAAQRSTIETDGKLLRVILTNLIDNALKYGAANAMVDVTLTVPPSPAPTISITVSNPVGRAGQPDPAQVFNKYYRSPLALGETGSGVGLHVASAMARMLGGELRYLPSAGTVVFELRMQAIASFGKTAVL
ncbi:MAG: sensor histidine kinase [Rhodoferax sp.]